MGRAKLMTDLTFRLAADTAQLKKGLASARKQMGTFQKTTQKLGGVLAGAFAGRALLSGIKSAILKIADLEKVIKRTSLIAGGGEKAFADLAKQLGGSTVFTAQEAGEAMTFLAQAGFDVNQILSATPGVLDLAAAAQLDLAMAADITSNVLSGYGLAASEVNRVNDILVLTTNSANLNVEQLGESFKMVAAVSKSAGISINKAAGFIGVMGDAGIQGTAAGTALRGVIARLIKPTAEGAAAMKRLGVEVSETSDGGLDLNKTLKDLRNAGLSTKSSLEIFGKIAFNAALVMSNASEKADDLAVAMGSDKGVGLAARQAKEQLNTLSGDIAKMESAWDGLILKGGSMNSIFRELTQSITDFINVIGGGHRDLDRLNAELDRMVGLSSEVNTVFSFLMGGWVDTEIAARELAMEIAKIEQAEFLANLQTKKSVDVGEEKVEVLEKIVAKTEEQVKAEAKELESLKKRRQESIALFGTLKTFLDLSKEGVSGTKKQTVANWGLVESIKALTESQKSQLASLTSGIKIEGVDLPGDTSAEDLEDNEGKKRKIIAASFNFAAGLTNTLQSMNNAALQADLAAAEDNEEKKTQLRIEHARKAQRISLGQALVNIAQGITGALPNLILAGIVAATGAVQIAAITSQKFASGGVSGGGFAMVGERGAEAVALPTGSRVLSHPDTMKAIGGEGGSRGKVSIFVSGFVGNERELALQITQVLDNQATSVNRLV